MRSEQQKRPICTRLGDITCKQTHVENMCSMLGCLTKIHINIKSELQSLKLQSLEVKMKLNLKLHIIQKQIQI